MHSCHTTRVIPDQCSMLYAMLGVKRYLSSPTPKLCVFENQHVYHAVQMRNSCIA